MSGITSIFQNYQTLKIKKKECCGLPDRVTDKGKKLGLNTTQSVKTRSSNKESINQVFCIQPNGPSLIKTVVKRCLWTFFIFTQGYIFTDFDARKGTGERNINMREISICCLQNIPD